MIGMQISQEPVSTHVCLVHGSQLAKVWPTSFARRWERILRTHGERKVCAQATTLLHGQDPFHTAQIDGLPQVKESLNYDPNFGTVRILR